MITQVVALKSLSMASIQRAKHGYCIAKGIVVLKDSVMLGEIDIDSIITGLSKWTYCSPRLCLPQNTLTGQQEIAMSQLSNNKSCAGSR